MYGIVSLLAKTIFYALILFIPSHFGNLSWMLEEDEVRELHGLKGDFVYWKIGLIILNWLVEMSSVYCIVVFIMSPLHWDWFCSVVTTWGTKCELSYFVVCDFMAFCLLNCSYSQEFMQLLIQLLKAKFTTNFLQYCHLSFFNLSVIGNCSFDIVSIFFI